VKGKFITFEGIEGSGKSSQITLLAEYLQARGREVVLTREPGGTPIADQIRKILLDPGNSALDPTAELLLYGASRAQHLREVVLPALASAAVVLCDRFTDATIAYQGHGRGLDLALIDTINRIVTAGIRPDLTIVLDLGASLGLARARGRNSRQGLQQEARFENENLIFHNKVRQGYLALASQDPSRIRIVDASLKPAEVQDRIRHITRQELEAP
jgi:dTMP kinase